MPDYPLHVQRSGYAEAHIGSLTADAAVSLAAEGSNGGSISYRRAKGQLTLNNGEIDVLSLDNTGRLLVNFATYSGGHIIVRGTVQDEEVMNITGLNQDSALFFSMATSSYSGSAAAMKVNSNSSAGRSLNAAGTINASGADYAEYMVKADNCGPIAKSDDCGVDGDGKLTKSWFAAISFVVKSTVPAYVGGDSWALHLPARPTVPVMPPIAPLPTKLSADASDEDRQLVAAAYRAACDAYAFAKVDHDAATARYATDLPIWEAQLEAARQRVDRIAFAGQVPVNIAGEFAVGDYLIALANGGGIQAVAVAEKDISFEQYRRRLGKV